MQTPEILLWSENSHGKLGVSLKFKFPHGMIPLEQDFPEERPSLLFLVPHKSSTSFDNCLFVSLFGCLVVCLFVCLGFIVSLENFTHFILSMIIEVKLFQYSNIVWLIGTRIHQTRFFKLVHYLRDELFKLSQRRRE